MGYFSNGTEGMRYEEDYCGKCINQENCPIWGLHFLWNYDQCADTPVGNAKKDALEMFIPRDKDGWNQQCVMFKPVEAL